MSNGNFGFQDTNDLPGRAGQLSDFHGAHGREQRGICPRCAPAAQSGGGIGAFEQGVSRGAARKRIGDFDRRPCRADAANGAVGRRGNPPRRRLAEDCERPRAYRRLGREHFRTSDFTGGNERYGDAARSRADGRRGARDAPGEARAR